jgi:dihydropteroate synthase/2-amino-4-hydroxy-6-hydroxymethyldihydropteridine diphosphokinase
MAIYLSLGSNLGERRQMLELALDRLGGAGVVIDRVSPVVETQALLPPGAPSHWQLPFLNLVVECRAGHTPQAMLSVIKTIEQDLGRSADGHWAPRPIDIDIVLWNDERIETESLQIPHRELHRRAFVLTPLAMLDCGLRLPGHDGQTVLKLLRALGPSLPLWMGIVNLTPDSFSDGGRYLDDGKRAVLLDEMLAAGVQLIDLGAESTRPGAEPLSIADETARLEPALTALRQRFDGRWLKPWISVDTYHAEVAARALALGADMINDVGGLQDPAMLELAASGSAHWVAMHSLSIPADPQVHLPTAENVVDQVERWLDTSLRRWTDAGIALERIVFDPGIGFGKTPLQSLELLQGIDRFLRKDVRLLVGHSRKSFMQPLVGDDLRARDEMTAGMSMELCRQGVDILRVHNVPLHSNSYRGWARARRP